MKITTVFHLLILSIVFAGSTFAQSDFEVTKALAESGDAVAQIDLGFVYETGDGVPKDVAEAVKWFRLAAEQGHAFAQAKLGKIYNNGEGVPENDAEAVKWYRLAADWGYANAQNSLGLMYFNGEGVPQNNIKAYVWWSVSAAQGFEAAKGNRDIVAAKLTPQDLSAGQAIATKCFESNYKDCE